MKERGGGAIVNTSSVWGVYPGPGHIAYCTSKGAVASFTKSLGRDHAPDGIRVNAVCPHEINTPMLRSGFERRGLDPQQGIEDLNKTVPLGHIAEPEEIADVMVFLASDEARYIAGETVEVTGPSPWAAERARGAVQLQGKIALVTGGGRGIGRGIVDRFLEEGAQVAVVQRQPLDDALDGHPRVAHVKADLASSSSTARRSGRRSSGSAVSTSSSTTPGSCSSARSPRSSRRSGISCMAVNLRAPLFLAQAALPHMRERGGGSIINIGSIEGLGANPDHAAYCASKAGIHGMTRAMAVDLGADNIRCNAIAPGWIASELSETYLESHPDPAAVRDALNRLHPLGRVGRPTDVGDLAVYLAGDRSSFLTGEIVVLDGGRTAKLPMPS